MMTEMKRVEERQQKRYRVLKALYDKTGDHTGGGTHYKEVFAEAGLDEDEGHEILAHLNQKGLLSNRTGVGWLALSHKGINEMEQSILHPERDTEHFRAGIVQHYYAAVGVVQNASHSVASVEQNNTASGRALNADQQLVTEREERRRRMLLRIYEKAEGSVHKHIHYEDVRNLEGLSKEDFRAVFDYLKAEGMVSDKYLGGIFEITQSGVEAAERLIRRPQAKDGFTSAPGEQHFYGPVGAVQNAAGSSAYVKQNNAAGASGL